MSFLHFLRLSKLTLGVLWAGLLLILGFWVLEHLGGGRWPWVGVVPQPVMGGGLDVHLIGRLLGVSAIGGGEFVLLWMVADDLCDGANVAVTGFCKTLAAMVFCLAGGTALWLVLS